MVWFSINTFPYFLVVSPKFDSNAAFALAINSAKLHMQHTYRADKKREENIGENGQLCELPIMSDQRPTILESFCIDDTIPAYTNLETLQQFFASVESVKRSNDCEAVVRVSSFTYIETIVDRRSIFAHDPVASGE